MRRFGRARSKRLTVGEHQPTPETVAVDTCGRPGELIGRDDDRGTGMELLDPDSMLYLVFHYLLLISLVILAIAALDTALEEFPFWAGLLVAVVLGLLYPRVVKAIGIAPTRWE